MTCLQSFQEVSWVRTGLLLSDMTAVVPVAVASVSSAFQGLGDLL